MTVTLLITMGAHPYARFNLVMSLAHVKDGICHARVAYVRVFVVME